MDEDKHFFPLKRVLACFFQMQSAFADDALTGTFDGHDQNSNKGNELL